MISNVVFTMNRPLQLEAYLETLYRHMPQELIQTYIIYKVDLFDKQYSGIFKSSPGWNVIREKNFHSDFLSLLTRLDTKYILFGTDDVVYFDTVSFDVIDETFNKFPDNIFGFSLRLSPESFRTGNDKITEIEVAAQSVYKLNWKNGQSRNARYPFELNSTVYRTDLVKNIVAHVAKERPLLKKIFAKESMLVKGLSQVISMKHFLHSMNTFHDPNSLESCCYRWCKTNKSKVRSYLYFQKLCASAVQINRVNTSVANPFDGSLEHTVEALNEKYKQGYRFDIEAIERDKPEETHVGQRYFRLIKKD